MMVLAEIRSAGLERIGILVENVPTLQDMDAASNTFFP